MHRAAAVILIALTMALGGCLVYSRHPPRHGHYYHRSRVRHHRACPPSHYWDGVRCRHKGRGHGARKHDY